MDSEDIKQGKISQELYDHLNEWIDLYVEENEGVLLTHILSALIATLSMAISENGIPPHRALEMLVVSFNEFYDKFESVRKEKE